MTSRCFIPLVLLFFFPVSFVSGQTTLLGGGLTYEYIGDSTGLPYHYMVRLQIYSMPDTALPQAVDITIGSSCFPDTVLTLYQAGSSAIGLGNFIWNQVNCGDTVRSHGHQVFSFFYRGTMILPGKCADYRLAYSGGHRDSTIANLINPGSTRFYTRSFLNNTLGSNTSARFLPDPRSIFCENISAFTLYNAIEPNNDSISFHLVSALDSAGTPVNYMSGLNFNNPIPSVGPFSISKLYPSQAGIYALALETREYRYDGTLSLYRQVGSVSFEFNVTVKNTCSKSLFSTAFGGPKVLDAIKNIHCGDSIISFRTDLFQGSTLSKNATEFRLLDVNSVPWPILQGHTYIRPDLLADSIWLKLHAPLLANDTLILYLKNGSDNNTLISPCGNEFPIYDSALVIVSDCGVTALAESKGKGDLSIYPNPTRDKVNIETMREDPVKSITLFDLQGRELKLVISDASSTEMDISALSHGMYLLKVETEKRQVTRLIQKQ